MDLFLVGSNPTPFNILFSPFFFLFLLVDLLFGLGGAGGALTINEYEFFGGSVL